MNNFSTILWDAGGVIVGFDQSKCDEKLASSSNKSASEVSTILFGDSIKGKGYNDGLVEKFNLGRISSKEFYESVRIALGLNMGYRDFAEAWIDIFSINEKILAFMRKAAARDASIILRTSSLSRPFSSAISDNADKNSEFI